ncbi:hypothetical protein HYU92_03345 [Candidatus Curtissbacteria bacterium]|nr:hypothetical protein [Candidatus Curtissbacteria bacterium]
MIYITIGVIILIVSFIIALVSLIREQKKVSNEAANQEVSPTSLELDPTNNNYGATAQQTGVEQQASVNSVSTKLPKLTENQVITSPSSGQLPKIEESQIEPQAGYTQPQAARQFPWDKQEEAPGAPETGSPRQKDSRQISGEIVPRDIFEENN